MTVYAYWLVGLVLGVLIGLYIQELRYRKLRSLLEDRSRQLVKELYALDEATEQIAELQRKLRKLEIVEFQRNRDRAKRPT